MSSYFKRLIYKIILKFHKFVVHNLVNFVFYPNTADTEYKYSSFASNLRSPKGANFQ